MQVYTDQKKEIKRRTDEHDFSLKQSKSATFFPFTNKRPEAISQSKVKQLANHSPRVWQLQAYQEMAKDNVATRPIQKVANKTGLPYTLKTGIENLSGHAMDNVKVHYNSDKPAQLNAYAYAQGTDIHLASGQEKHLAHEAWHVAQQKQGRVQPTRQMMGRANINDDQGLEKEADVMGDLATKPIKEVSANTTNQLKEKTVVRQLKGAGNAVVQRTEIDAIKYVNKKGLWHVRKDTDNWLIKLLAELWYAQYINQYNAIYKILIKNLPVKPLPGTDGYDPPTVDEVNIALSEEKQKLKLVKLPGLTSDGFRTNHVRSDKSSAVERCRYRLKHSNPPGNTVLILSANETKNILITLMRAKLNNWDFIYIQCSEAIQASFTGIKRLLNVTVKVGFDLHGKINHLYGNSLDYKGSDDKIG